MSRGLVYSGWPLEGGVPARLPGAVGAPPSPPPAVRGVPGPGVPCRLGALPEAATGAAGRPVCLRSFSSRCHLSSSRGRRPAPLAGGRRSTWACPAEHSRKTGYAGGSGFEPCLGAFAAPPVLFVNARHVKSPPCAWVPCPRGSLEDHGASERLAVTPDATDLDSREAVVFSDELALVLIVTLSRRTLSR